MKRESYIKLSLDRASTYQIQVPGMIDLGLNEWDGITDIKLERDCDGSALTTLTGIFDQAGLIGLLRRLISLGLPIISVAHIDQRVIDA